MDSDYSIPIVQGTAVPVDNQYSKNSYSPAATMIPDEDHFGNDQTATIHAAGNVQPRQQQQQPNQFRDVVWAVAFVLHLGAMIFVISMNIANGDGGDGFSAYKGLFFLVGMTAIVSIGLSSATIGLMMRYPTEMVKIGLLFSTVLVGLMAVMGIMTGDVIASIMGIAFFAITVCYVKAVWARIPFAAANLNTALTAVKSNIGLAFVAYCIMAMAFAWSGFWFMGMASSLSSSNGGVVFLLLVSYYWTHQVLSNTVHVTTAGTVGTWWFVPGEANGCWSSALRDSFCRATSYSFGSICLGSLLVAVVQALRMMAHQARQNDDMQLLACLIECFLACIQDIIEYFNKWAYVYVGLYGFGYIEAGRNVIQLFQQKGWTVIITDDLTDRVLMMMSICVGIVTGLVGMVIALADQNLLGDLGLEGNVAFIAFFISFIVGIVFCSILMSVVGSAVNTVIVCFAESPAEFEANHPGLSREMRSAWVQAWPELTI